MPPEPSPGLRDTASAERRARPKRFLGFAPADDPQIVIYVVLDRINNKKQDEASRACEVARKILSEALPYLNIYMTEPLSYMEQVELEKMGLHDTNDRAPQSDQEGQ